MQLDPNRFDSAVRAAVDRFSPLTDSVLLVGPFRGLDLAIKWWSSVVLELVSEEKKILAKQTLNTASAEILCLCAVVLASAAWILTWSFKRAGSSPECDPEPLLRDVFLEQAASQRAAGNRWS